MTRHRTETVTETRRVPLDGAIFGWGAMLPFPALALAAWTAEPTLAALARGAAILWGAAILCFLAGVRRGLSFRTPGGPRAAQLVTMLWLFLAGLAALVLPAGGALVLLTAGYASLAVLDPIAARRDEAPLYFTRLRPWQMALAAVSLGLLWLGAA